MLQKTVLKLIGLYQKSLLIDNPIRKMFLPGDSVCRFQPTCSNYMYESVQKHGTIKGVMYGLYRIVRCNPWSKGGFDPIP
jgi:putative membrane protein insertion efficiency factor